MSALVGCGGTRTPLPCLSFPSSPSPAIPKGSQRELFSPGGNGDVVWLPLRCPRVEHPRGHPRAGEKENPPRCSEPQRAPLLSLPVPTASPPSLAAAPSARDSRVTSHRVPGKTNIAAARPETAPERGDSQGESGA